MMEFIDVNLCESNIIKTQIKIDSSYFGYHKLEWRSDMKL